MQKDLVYAAFFFDNVEPNFRQVRSHVKSVHALLSSLSMAMDDTIATAEEAIFIRILLHKSFQE